MTPSALATEHGNCAGHDAGDAHHDVKAHDGEEAGVDRWHRHAEHDGCLIGHESSPRHRPPSFAAMTDSTSHQGWMRVLFLIFRKYRSTVAPIRPRFQP